MARPRNSDRSLIKRFRDSRFVRVLLVYVGISWPILGVTGTLQDVLLLPDWVSPATLALLLIGLVVVLATAWIRSSPLLEKLAGLVPQSWVVAWRDVVRDLRRGRFPDVTWGRALAVVLFTAWLFFGFAGVYVVVKGPAVPSAPMAAVEVGSGLAVTPFAASGGDRNAYGEGMVNLLSTTLDGVAGLRAIHSRTVLAQWEEAVEGVATPDLGTTLEVGRAVGARYVLTGSAVEVGSELSLVADIYDVGTGAKLESVQVHGPADSVMALVERLSVAAARALIEQVGGDGSSVQHLDGLVTSSLTALRAYLEGERLYRAGNFDAALEAYERAIHADSTFALAHLRAGLLYGWEGSAASQPDHAAHLLNAARYSARLPPRERALLTTKELATEDPAGAIARLERDTRLYPDDPDLWEAVGELYYHEGPRVLEPRAKGIAAFNTAIELDADFAPYLIHVTEFAISFADSVEAAWWVGREGELAPGEAFTRAHRHAFTLVYGDPADRAAVLDTIRSTGAAPGYLFQALQGPRRLEPRQAALAAAVTHEARLDRVRGLLYTRINRGQRVEESPFGLVVMAVLGLTPPPDLRVVKEIGYPPVSAMAAATGGLTAAFREEQAQALQMEETLRQRDPGEAEWVAQLRRLNLGIATLKDGRPEDALPLLETSLHEVGPEHFVGMILFLLGDAHEALGQDRPALDHFLAAADERGGQASLALLRAARLHQRLGQTDAALALYRDLIVAWENADPFFQEWVEEARRSLPDR